LTGDRSPIDEVWNGNRLQIVKFRLLQRLDFLAGDECIEVMSDLFEQQLFGIVEFGSLFKFMLQRFCLMVMIALDTANTMFME